MDDFLRFLALVANELYELFVYTKSAQADPEKEKRIAAAIIRKASDERARAEITDA